MCIDVNVQIGLFNISVMYFCNIGNVFYEATLEIFIWHYELIKNLGNRDLCVGNHICLEIFLLGCFSTYGT